MIRHWKNPVPIQYGIRPVQGMVMSMARHRLPSFYLPLLLLALCAGMAAYLEGSIAAIRLGIGIGFGVSVVLIIADAMALWRGEGIIGRMLLNVGVLYWFWLDALTSALQEPAFPAPESLYPYFYLHVPEPVVAVGLLCVNLFSLALMLGWRHMPIPRKILSRLADREDPQPARLFDLINLLLAVCGWIPVMLAYRGNILLALSDMLLMRSGGGSGIAQDVGLMHHLSLIGVFGGALALARILLRTPGQNWMRYLAMSLMLPLIILGSSRFVWGYLALPAVLMLVARSRNRLRWSRRRTTAMVVGVLVILVNLFQGAARNQGVVEFLNDREGQEESFIDKGFFGHEHFGAMLMAIDLVEVNGGFFYEMMAPYFITHFIPRRFWPNKPYPRSWQTYNQTVTGGHAFNVTPSVTGQYYMNWGYPGVFWIGLFLGWLARLTEVWFGRLQIERQMLSATICGLLLAFAFLSFRFFYPLYFSFPLFGFIAYWVISRRVPRRRFPLVQK